MGTYAAKTEVTSTRSRDEIEHTLTRYGADQFAYGWADEGAVIGFRMKGRQIKFTIPLPKRDDPQFTEYEQRGKKWLRAPEAAAKLYEQAVRQKWRALALVVKAKLEAVEAGISVFDDEFMAHIMIDRGQTMGDWMRPQIEQYYLTGAAPSSLPMLEAPKK